MYTVEELRKFVRKKVRIICTDDIVCEGIIYGVSYGEEEDDNKDYILLAYEDRTYLTQIFFDEIKEFIEL